MKILKWIGMAMVGLLILFCVSGLIYLMIRLTGGSEYRLTDTIELVALSNNIEIEGHFTFLGSGVIDSKLAYTFMYRKDDGSYQMSSIPACDTRIYETSSRTPCIEVYQAFNKIEWFGESKIRNEWNPDLYHVYIPEGSIWQGYNVDVRR